MAERPDCPLMWSHYGDQVTCPPFLVQIIYIVLGDGIGGGKGDGVTRC